MKAPFPIWFYSARNWKPRWYHRLGVPMFGGGDEYGRLTVVVGFMAIGYMVVAYWRCRCDDCVESRLYQAQIQEFGEGMADVLRTARERRQFRLQRLQDGEDGEARDV